MLACCNSCTRMLQAFVPNISFVFRRMLQVCLSRCCICFTHMFASVLSRCCMCFQWFQVVFQVCFVSVSDTCFKCFICLHTYVASAASEYFKSRLCVISSSSPSTASSRCVPSALAGHHKTPRPVLLNQRRRPLPIFLLGRRRPHVERVKRSAGTDIRVLALS
jgi:hypothetical protein